MRNRIEYSSYSLISIHMSDSHDDKAGAAKSSGSSMDFGITSMIGGFFGVVSGAGATKSYIDGSSGGNDHH